MDKFIVFDPNLSKADQLLLQNLAADLKSQNRNGTASNGQSVNGKADPDDQPDESCDEVTLSYLNALNDPKQKEFEPTIFNSVDYDKIKWNVFNRWCLPPYIRVAQSVVRYETDVVMFTHLLLYFTTSVPSALALFFWKFTWIHGILHFIMQVSYMGTYTLMMHQHIHQRGILQKRFWVFDRVFPYITDMLMGHTWNSYYYHHVKHHHIEGNGPTDLSSTIRYQRDDILQFLHYVGKFFFFIWFDLPLYFIRNRKNGLAAKMLFWEFGSYITLYTLYTLNSRATICVFLGPLVLLRLGLMVGNWGQHAFVDDQEPACDYRSSITLIDVQVFHNIDYIMITLKLMMKDYQHLAKCMVPIGEEQLAMNLDQRVALLKKHTRRFTEEEIKAKFKKA